MSTINSLGPSIGKLEVGAKANTPLDEVAAGLRGFTPENELIPARAPAGALGQVACDQGPIRVNRVPHVRLACLSSSNPSSEGGFLRGTGSRLFLFSKRIAKL